MVSTELDCQTRCQLVVLLHTCLKNGAQASFSAVHGAVSVGSQGNGLDGFDRTAIVAHIPPSGEKGEAEEFFL